MFKQLFVSALLLCLSVTTFAAHPLEGKWVGRIESDNGQMQIGLELKEANGKLSGEIKSPHGDWTVTSVTEAKGTLTVTFSADDHDGKMIGAIKDGHFTGKWDNSPMAVGTFDLTKAAAKTP